MSLIAANPRERLRRWKLALGEESTDLSKEDQRLSTALSALYNLSSQGKGRGGLGASAPRVSRWLGDIRDFFPTPVVQVIQKDAFERLNLKSLMLEPEFLATLEADVHLVADLISLRSAIPDKTKDTARMVVRKVVNALLARLEHKTVETVGGAINRAQRTRRPRHSDIDWDRTILANLRHYQQKQRTVIPETLIGLKRKARTRANLDHVMLCVDQSGSMASSVVYASIFAAVLASLPGLATQLICFDTAIVDLTEQLSDPVEVLFGVQLGGGTDINSALAYCEKHIEHPSKTHLILISDLYEGGNAESMLARVAVLKQSGVKVIVLLTLSDDGHPAYNNDHAVKIASMHCPVFGCTPDQFPDLMAVALTGRDVEQWAASKDIALVRGRIWFARSFVPVESHCSADTLSQITAVVGGLEKWDTRGVFHFSMPPFRPHLLVQMLIAFIFKGVLQDVIVICHAEIVVRPDKGYSERDHEVWLAMPASIVTCASRSRCSDRQ